MTSAIHSARKTRSLSLQVLTLVTILAVCAPWAQAQNSKPATVTPIQQQQTPTTVSPVDMSTQPQRTDSATVTPISPDAAAFHGDIKLGVGDLIAIKVYGVSELTDEVRVNGAGDISLPLVGNVHIEGLTSEKAERMLEKKLVDGGFLREPHVSIFVKEYVTQGVSVMGEVGRPGIYPMLGARRLFDALSIAGGPTKNAGSLVVITRHDNPQVPTNVNLSSDPVLNGAANVEIFPGDIINVSKAGVVYVVGEVSKPGGFVIENNEQITVLQVMAMAGGQSKTASLRNSRIIRKSSEGLRTELPVPLDKIMTGKEKDVTLQANDILFVPNSAAKEFGNKGLQSVLNTISGLLIFRP